MEQRDLVSKIVTKIESKIEGRVANYIGSRRYNSVETLLSYVQRAGEGNHLEIGTLFGGSAIAVACLKQALVELGLVVCIDPLNGYYAQKAPRSDCVDPISGVAVVPSTFFRNVEKFGVENRVCLLKSISDLVLPFTGIKFKTAYIDGNHDAQYPLYDWALVKDAVTEYILFDNYDDFHPNIKEICARASDDPEWDALGVEGITFILRRVHGL